MPSPKAPAALLYARSCYDHLAGELAVQLFDRLSEDGRIVVDLDEGTVLLTSSGESLFTELGVDLDTARRAKRATLRPCLDWTQRRHHLAGSAAAGLLDALFDRGWIVRGAAARSVELTERGRRGLTNTIGVDLAAVSSAVT